MAPKYSASAASAKRKSFSSDKYSDGSRAKKAKTVTALPKRQKFDDDADVASDNDGSGFSDSADGGAPLKGVKSSRGLMKPKENGRTVEKPDERSLFRPV
jgi:hypothetical protein